MSMRHYEIVLLVHPECGEQLPLMLQKYQELVQACGGTLHRHEDWGKRQLAYPVKKFTKAHYFLYNIEVPVSGLDALATAFRYNDNVLRCLIVQEAQAITEPSPFMRNREERKDGPGHAPLDRRTSSRGADEGLAIDGEPAE